MVDIVTLNHSEREERRVSSIDRPTPQSSGDPREDILKAAESCFEYFGFRKTTVDDIAKSAGISRTTVYRFFKDRDALLSALVLSHGEDLMSATRAHVEKFSAFEDILVEGMLFQIEYGRKDLFWRLARQPGIHGHHQPIHHLVIRDTRTDDAALGTAHRCRTRTWRGQHRPRRARRVPLDRLGQCHRLQQQRPRTRRH